MPQVNSRTYVYHPKDFKRSNRILAAGRLRPLATVLLNRALARLRMRWTKRRPFRYREHWPSVAWNSIPRNGHQLRREQQRRNAMRLQRRRSRPSGQRTLER